MWPGKFKDGFPKEGKSGQVDRNYRPGSIFHKEYSIYSRVYPTENGVCKNLTGKDPDMSGTDNSWPRLRPEAEMQ